MTSDTRKGFIAGGLCIVFFIGSQMFQELAYRLWIPGATGPADELANHLLAVDEARALLVMAGIVALIVPFVVIALRFFRSAPIASTIGVLFGFAFIGFELTTRSVDFFVVGANLARQFADTVPGPERDAVLQRFALWNEIESSLLFPLRSSYLVASCAFAVATWRGVGRAWWSRLPPAAYGLNALRLLARSLSTFAGQDWLAGFNDRLYFPSVLAINALLAIWFFASAKGKTDHEATDR